MGCFSISQPGDDDGDGDGDGDDDSDDGDGIVEGDGPIPMTSLHISTLLLHLPPVVNASPVIHEAPDENYVA